MTTTIYMVRHGATQANMEDRFAGHDPYPLHPDGESQMALVAERLKKKSIQAVFSGTLSRTIASAGIIARTVGCPVFREDGLDDMRIPHWDGKTKQEITRRYGSQYPTWKKTPHLLHVAGCETLHDVQQRAAACLHSIATLSPERAIVMVSHLIILRTLVLYCRGDGLERFRSVTIKNGDIIAVNSNAAGFTVTMPDP